MKFFIISLFIFHSAILHAQECFQSKHIALDIGHSPKKPGAISSRGVSEYSYNLNLIQRLRARLKAENAGKITVLTEKNPEMPLHARASLANAYKADVLISIHHDSVQPRYLSAWQYEGEEQHYSDKFRGYSLFFSSFGTKPKESARLAETLGQQFYQHGLQPTLHHAEKITGESRKLYNADLGVYQFDELAILRRSKIPAVLIECGVLVNRDEELLLASDAYQSLLVDVIVAGLRDFFACPESAEPTPDEPELKALGKMD